MLDNILSGTRAKKTPAIFLMPYRFPKKNVSLSFNVETTALVEGQKDAQQQDQELPFNPSLLQFEVYFKSEEVIAVSL